MTSSFCSQSTSLPNHSVFLVFLMLYFTQGLFLLLLLLFFFFVPFSTYCLYPFNEKPQSFYYQLNFGYVSIIFSLTAYGKNFYYGQPLLQNFSSKIYMLPFIHYLRQPRRESPFTLSTQNNSKLRENEQAKVNQQISMAQDGFELSLIP